MAKRKALEPLERQPGKINMSTHFVYYQPALHTKIRKVTSTKIRQSRIYRFFIDYDCKYFFLQSTLDLGSTSFVISHQEAKACPIPVVKRPRPIM